MSYHNFLKTHLRDNYQIVFANLSACNCCSRHQFNKPNFIYDIYKNIYEPDYYAYFDNLEEALFFDSNEINPKR